MFGNKQVEPIKPKIVHWNASTNSKMTYNCRKT